MDRIWERSLTERITRQKGKARELLIGCYAPREPRVMELLLAFLKCEKRFPLALAHRIVDRFTAMTLCTTVATYDEMVAFINGIPDAFGIAVGPCACRLCTAESLGPDAMDLKAGRLDKFRSSPLNVDIQIAKCAEKFGALPTYKRITKAELLQLEAECFNMGLVSNIYALWGGEAGICHCSSVTCVPFMANEALKQGSRVIKKGNLIAHTDTAACKGTGDCVNVCHFKARRLVDDAAGRRLVVNASQCYGCGLCAAVCPEKAITMIPRME